MNKIVLRNVFQYFIIFKLYIFQGSMNCNVIEPFNALPVELQRFAPVAELLPPVLVESPEELAHRRRGRVPSLPHDVPNQPGPPHLGLQLRHPVQPDPVHLIRGGPGQRRVEEEAGAVQRPGLRLVRQGGQAWVGGWVGERCPLKKYEEAEKYGKIINFLEVRIHF